MQLTTMDLAIRTLRSALRSTEREIGDKVAEGHSSHSQALQDLIRRRENLKEAIDDMYEDYWPLRDREAG